MKSLIGIISCLPAIVLCVSLQAQNYTFGLNRPLEDKYLPKSRVETVQPERVPKPDLAARLAKPSATEGHRGKA